jgi:uncharacterized membrane protein
MPTRMLDDGESRERFKHRLEAFSDIVFGLSLSQLALQLALPAHAADLIQNPVRYAIFFGTFAIICAIWMTHHRMFQLAFEPDPPDIALNFVYLAFVAILPFAMQVNVRFAGSPIGFGFYIVDFIGFSLPMFGLLQRGLARCSPHLSGGQRLQLWRAVLRNRLILAASLTSLALIPLAGVAFAWIPFVFLSFATVAVRRRVHAVPARYLPVTTGPTPANATAKPLA